MKAMVLRILAIEGMQATAAHDHIWMDVKAIALVHVLVHAQVSKVNDHELPNNNSAEFETPEREPRLVQRQDFNFIILFISGFCMHSTPAPLKKCTQSNHGNANYPISATCMKKFYTDVFSCIYGIVGEWASRLNLR
jgi:hypothetical protein